MSDRGKPHNVGQAIFESLGQGLQALSGILETDRQNKLQDLQLQMNMEVQQARLEKLRVSTALSQEALNLASETPEETRERQLFEAQTQTMADLQELETTLLELTGQPSIAPFPSAIAGLQQTAQDIGMDFSVGDFDFAVTEPSAGIADFSGLLGAGNLEVDDITYNPDGSIKSVSLGRPRQERAGISKEERARSGRALSNSVIDRLREINPSKLKSIMAQRGFKMEDFLDEANLKSLALDEFAEKRDRPGLFTGDDIIPDEELLNRIGALRSFREGGQIQSDDQVAQQKVKTPTPRQDAIGWLSNNTDNWSANSPKVRAGELSIATQEEKDRAIQGTIDFQVVNGRLPNDTEELLNWLQ